MSDDSKVELKVATDFRKIIADLESLQKKAASVGEQVKRVGNDLDKNLQRNSKNTETHFERVRDFGRRLADQLRGYFADVASSTANALEGVKKDLGLRQQFIDATKGAVDLHDTLRKIGGTLGINADRMTIFAQRATQAFAGFSQSDVARTMEGIAKTQVRGEDNILAYGTTAANLGLAGGQTDSSGDIAEKMAGVLRARGIDQNNIGEMTKLAADVNKTRKLTGASPTETLDKWRGTYETMGDDTKRRGIGTDAMRNFSAIEAVVGPQFGKLVDELSQGKLKNLPRSAQGLGNLIGPNGFNFDALDKVKNGGNRIFDKEASWQTFGLSPESAQAMIRTLELSKQARAAQNAANGMGGNLSGDAASSRGILENAGAIKNNVTGAIGGAMQPAVGAANGWLAKRTSSATASAITMGEGFLAASAGAYALSQLGKKAGGKLGGVGNFVNSGLKAAALEQITGQKTIPVFVVNLGEIGSGGIGSGAGLGGAAGNLNKAADALGKASLVITAAMAGYEIGTYLEGIIDKNTQGTSADGNYTGNAIERGMYDFSKMLDIMGDGIDRMINGAKKTGNRANELKQKGLDQTTRQVKIDTTPSQRARGSAAATPKQ